MSWAEERRADRVVAREQARLDADAASERRLRERARLGELAREERASRARERGEARAQARVRRAARWAGVRSWTAAHVVDLLIYPLAGASAVMAVPAMASYGRQVYGSATGVVLPVISELGMWVFALAVMASRRRDASRSVWSLQVGIAVFAAMGLCLNFLHGWSTRGHSAADATVMGLVSVAGVLAHQLAVASPRRTRGERGERRIQRLAAKRVARTRRLALRQAVAELSADGAVRLVYAPGRYLPRRDRLERATVPGLPVSADDEWDSALAALLAGPDGRSTIEADQQRYDQLSEGESAGGGSVATLERPNGRHPIDPQARRNLTPDEALDAARRLARRHGKPVTAEQLRTALRIAARSARELRDVVNTELFGDESTH